MPRKKKSNIQSGGTPSAEPKIPKELLDQLLDARVFLLQLEVVAALLRLPVLCHLVVWQTSCRSAMDLPPFRCFNIPQSRHRVSAA